MLDDPASKLTALGCSSAGASAGTPAALLHPSPPLLRSEWALASLGTDATATAAQLTTVATASAAPDPRPLRPRVASHRRPTGRLALPLTKAAEIRTALRSQQLDGLSAQLDRGPRRPPPASASHAFARRARA